MLEPLPFRLFANPRRSRPRAGILPAAGYRRAKAEITGWDGYAVTPLCDLPSLAREARLEAVRLKDESERFGLGSFKALGGAYAVAVVLADELARRGIARAARSADLDHGTYRQATSTITVTCATDGNHGRSVAWGAQRFHCRCVIFVHEAVSQSRIDAIAHFGAEVRRVAGTYDDAVRESARQAEAHGWFIVSDTAWPGYAEVPRTVMQGYRLMADEAADDWDGGPPSHVFVQGGVGGVAAAVSVQLRARFQPAPALIVVEPERAACLLASAELGEPTAIPGDLDTVMAGLACGEPSLLAWQELNHAATAFMTVPDEAAIACMRLLAEQGIVAGESGVAGLAGCLLSAAEPAAREVLGLDQRSRVLLFNTEGATDPALYTELVGRTPAEIAARKAGRM
jgi:diaminopropionate ammonia-lyase